MIFIILNLLLISVISIVVVATINHSLGRWIVSILFSLFIVLEVSSLFIGGSLIDYKFYVHFNFRDMMAMKSLFAMQTVSLLIALVILSILIQWLGKKIIKLSWYPKKLYRFGFMVGAAIILSLNGGIINNIVSIIRIVNATDLNFEAALSNLEMDSYVTSDKVVGETGKNIIVISLESYESGYLSDGMAHLTPNMRSLTSSWNYYDMVQTSGSGWTSASLYTYLTGLPSFFQGNGNLAFQNSQYSHITGISHVLKSAGYDLTYLVGNADFAGTEDLLNAFQITNVIDYKKLKDKYETNKSWGIHDKDLFEEAKLEISEKKEKEKPFAMFLSTISTHNPNGVYDERMEELVQSQNTDLEFMAASVDFLVGDFIDFLETEGMLTNTTVYIFPDHLKMGDGSMFNNTGERGLFLLTNASNNDLNFISNNIYQIDLPKIILEGAAVDNNARFLTSYIEGDKEEFIRDNSAQIASLNSSGLVRDGFWTENLKIELNFSGDLEIDFDNNEVTVSSDTAKNLISTLTFTDEMRFKGIEYNSKESPRSKSPEITLSLYKKDGILFSYLQKDGKTPLLKSDKKKVEFTLDDIEIISKLHLKKESSLFIEEANELIMVNSSSEKSYIQHLTNIPYDITEAILEIEYSTIGEAKPFVILYGQPYNSSTIALHDQLSNSTEKTTIQIPFKKFVQKPALVFRNWSKKGSFTITKYKILGSGYDNGTKLPQKSKHIDEYSSDKNRFIAHGGGAIGGLTYTNSLEALNNSYEKGFRLFELDIIKTSDGKYVAGHDWSHWSKITGFEGNVPVSEREFLKHKIYKKFTPLNMKLINDWFQSHSDALLVTDKVNEPKQFAQLFVDKTRLMMELFSLEAVKEGLALGIKSAMPSENVVNGLGKDKVAALKALGVKHIAVSRRFIAPNIELMEQLKDNDIKVYVFHVNFEKGKDENYVVNYEMDYIYGMYADKWSFD